MKEVPFSKDEIAHELQRLQTKIQQSEEALKEATEMLKRMCNLELSRASNNDTGIEETSNTKNSEYRSAALAQLESVRSYAKAKKMSDQVIADKTGLSRPNVSRMLSGKNIPRLDTFMMLCEAVGLPSIDIANSTK